MAEGSDADDGLEADEGSEGEACEDGADEAGWDVAWRYVLVSMARREERNVGKVLLTGAKLGGTTLPESETDHPLGSPGGVPKVCVGAAVALVTQGYTLDRSAGVKGMG